MISTLLSRFAYPAFLLLAILLAVTTGMQNGQTSPSVQIGRVVLSPPDIVADQRYADIAGNLYSPLYVDNFTYGPPSRVVILYQKKARTFMGRLVAQNLKPFFAYQLKLVGTSAHVSSMEKLGYNGRWLIQVGGTNFSDEDYRSLEDKSLAEGYIFFDWFVTDDSGNAQLDFALDTANHVLVSENLEYSHPPVGISASTFFVNRFAPPAYDRAHVSSIARLWALCEFDWSGRRAEAGHTRLPVGRYKCLVRLTEECFHGNEGGGYWATALDGEVEFEIEH